MNFTEYHPLNNLIQTLSDKKGSKITFEELKEELVKNDENGIPFYNLSFKENEDLCLIYNNDHPDREPTELEMNCRSYILDKTNLECVGTQFNKIVYNQDAVNYINEKEKTDDQFWNNVVVQPCYEGTILLVFYHNNSWYVSTRRCLSAQDSKWVRNKSYMDMFKEAIKNKFDFDDLDKNYCYTFILVHYKNKNIVNYTNLGKEYKEVFHIITTEKYTVNEVEYEIPNISKIESLKTKGLDDLLALLNSVSNENQTKRRVTTEGFVLRVYEGEKYKSCFRILKLQTELYQKLMRIKPNNSNIHQSYLELFQKDKLNDFLPYFSKYNNNIVKRISNAMKTISKEILNLYHLTRDKKNPNIYTQLGKNYKKILFGLHGLYIEHKKKELNNKLVNDQVSNDEVSNDEVSNDEVNNTSNSNEELVDYHISKSINVNDVYYYLKSLSPYDLRQIFFERTSMLDNDDFTFMNKKCINTMTQSTLMFGTKD